MKQSQETNEQDAMLEAARLNWRLWTIFQAELLDPNCEVPTDIRGNIISLSNFIDKHTVAFIAEPAREKLDVLININRDLASGLYATPEEGQQAQSGTEAPRSGGQSDQPPPGDTPSLKISV